MAQKKTLTDEEIIKRIELGSPDRGGYMSRMAELDRRLSGMFRRPGEADAMVDVADDSDFIVIDDVVSDRQVGISTQFQTNIYTKLAAIGINDPDWHVVMRPDVDSALAFIAREYLRTLWRKWNWRRVAQKALLKRYVCGLGAVTYRWDQLRGYQLEHVNSWDISCDCRDGNWSDLRWAARRVMMTRRDIWEWFQDEDFRPDGNDLTSMDRRHAVWVYWDEATEAVILEDRILRRSPNLYGRIPIIFMLGDIDAGATPFPLGDTLLAAGHIKELEDLTAMLSNIARNGRSINVVTEQMLSKSFEDTIRDGLELGWVAVKDLSSMSYMRVPAEDMSQALMEAINMSRNELDSATGVTGVQRGVPTNNFKFATEAALVANQSGARAVQARVEYECFLEEIARTIIETTVKFGGVSYDENGEVIESEETSLLWEAAYGVQEVRVVEGSSLYRDPQQDQQQAMQLFNLMLQAAPMFVQMGLPVPNLQRFAEDMLRAFGRRNTGEYWITAPTAGGFGPAPEGEAGGGGGALS